MILNMNTRQTDTELLINRVRQEFWYEQELQEALDRLVQCHNQRLIDYSTNTVLSDED
jgi:hypothetical protein